MEGLEISEINLSEVKTASYSQRLDSNYFQKEFLQDENLFKQWESLQYIADIKSGTTPKERDENLKNGIILLKTNDIRNNILQDKQHDYFYIDEKTNNSMKSSQLKESDILINIVGATTDVIGRVSFVPKYFPKSNITQAMSFIRVSNSSYNAETLFIFLQSKYGNKQTRRIARPTGQYNINNEELGSYKIPLFSLPFQSKIETMVKNAHRKLDNSKMLYTQAQNILISELGLENFNPSNEKVSIKTLKESFFKTGRLDSEYYQPKYDEILNKITKYGCSEFTNFVDSYTTGYPYSSDSYVEKDGIVLIKISNINNFKLDISSASLIPKNDIDLSAENVVQKNDILVSMSGTIGNSCIVQDDIKAVVNQRIMKIKSKNINPVVFSLIINSMIGKNQLERIQTGGVQANISPKDILKIQIPCIKTSVQDEIANYIKQSMEYSKKAKELLEISTKSVEIAIDKDEQAAHNFLEQNRTEQNRTEQNRL